MTGRIVAVRPGGVTRCVDSESECGSPDSVGVPPYTQRMSMTVADVEQALPALDQHDRAAVIHSGLQSLHLEDAKVDQAEVDAARRIELRRRIDDIESRKAELLDVDESHAQLRAELAARRK